ncbi:hypothetical protein PROFUN_15610 [Planoprotostelium fungivorum]|uniref:Uncharacterized protein n=1 Tax=Planoprotostelium fungivorum TaxID=1890364 RepID=A0A2P6MYM9_9EUKA|nr:hypothetical protein PROFUN_15610 [Planoprotostelium fungivorum]
MSTCEPCSEQQTVKGMFSQPTWRSPLFPHKNVHPPGGSILKNLSMEWACGGILHMEISLIPGFGYWKDYTQNKPGKATYSEELKDKVVYLLNKYPQMQPSTLQGALLEDVELPKVRGLVQRTRKIIENEPDKVDAAVSRVRNLIKSGETTVPDLSQSDAVMVDDDEEFVPEASGKKVVKNSTVSASSATLVKVSPRVSPPLDTESIISIN